MNEASLHHDAAATAVSEEAESKQTIKSNTLAPMVAGSSNNNNNNSPSSLRSLDDFLQQAVTAYNNNYSYEYIHNRHPELNHRWFNHVPRILFHQWRYWLLFFCLGVANSSDAAEILCISYILADDNFAHSMLHSSTADAGLLAATVFCGMLVGGLLVGGSLGDLYWGRRPTLLAGLALNTVAGFLSAFSPNVYLLALMRFVAGLGIGTTIPPLFTLCSELSAPSLRGLGVTIAASFWMVGSLYVALIAWWWFGHYYYHHHHNASAWRVFAALCAAPSALGLILVYRYVPESPRFLLLQGNYPKAMLVVHDLSDRLRYRGPSWTMEEVQEHAPPAVHRHMHVLTFARLVQDFRHSASQLYIPQLRQTTWPLQIIWFSLSFGSYGLYTWINTLFFAVHLENVYFNALLFALSNLPGNILSAALMDCVGRTKLLICSVVAAALSLVSFAYVAFRDDDSNSNNNSGKTERDDSLLVSKSWIVVSACAFQCFTIISWNAIDVLTSELFPTTVRSTGMGMCAASGRIGAMLAQFVNGALVANPVALLLVAALTLSLGALTPSLLPHDKTGQPISDTYEGEEEEESIVVNHSDIDDDTSVRPGPRTLHELTCRNSKATASGDPSYQSIVDESARYSMEHNSSTNLLA